MVGERTQNESVRVRVGKVDSICLFQVTEDELTTLEQGSPSSLLLNFSIALISIAISFLISLSTTKIESERVFIVFVVIAVISSIVGIILFGIWFRAHRSLNSVGKKIRERLKEESLPVAENAPDSISPSTKQNT